MAHSSKGTGCAFIDATKVLHLQGGARQAALRQELDDACVQQPGLGRPTAVRRAHKMAAHNFCKEPLANIAACRMTSPALNSPAEVHSSPPLPASTNSSCNTCKQARQHSERQAAYLAFTEQRRRRAAAAALIQASYR